MSANQNDPQFKLRVPPELKTKIEQSAKEHNRSLNADIVARLEKTFEHGLDKLLSAVKDAQRRRAISFGTYNISDDVPTVKAHEIAAVYLSEFLERHPDYRLINIEGTDRGIRYWYSYPVDESQQAKRMQS